MKSALLLLNPRCLSDVAPMTAAAGKLSVPFPEGAKILSPKIDKLVTDLSQLNLLEVAELSDALKRRLNLPDTPMMAMGSFAQQSSAKQEVGN